MSKKQATCPIVLIDTSFTSFYRFFATIRWYSFAYPDEFKEYKNNNLYDWKTNKIFIEKYEKMYLDSIIKLVKKKVFNESNIIFCMDSPKEHLWRTQMYCDYKSGRADLSQKHNFKTIFNYTYEIMIPNFIKNNNMFNSIKVDKMEADDIIAIISIYFVDKNPEQKIYLVSGDDDFLQLGRNNIIFINYKLKKQLILSEEEANKALEKKCILGDPSDCIPSIFTKGKRINKIEILESKDKLISFLNTNESALKQYEFNKKMIDFRNIPKIYFNKVIKIYEKLYVK